MALCVAEAEETMGSLFAAGESGLGGIEALENGRGGLRTTAPGAGRTTWGLPAVAGPGAGWGGGGFLAQPARSVTSNTSRTPRLEGAGATAVLNCCSWVLRE